MKNKYTTPSQSPISSLIISRFNFVQKPMIIVPFPRSSNLLPTFLSIDRYSIKDYRFNSCSQSSNRVQLFPLSMIIIRSAKPSSPIFFQLSYQLRLGIRISPSGISPLPVKFETWSSLVSRYVITNSSRKSNEISGIETE